MSSNSDLSMHETYSYEYCCCCTGMDYVSLPLGLSVITYQVPGIYQCVTTSLRGGIIALSVPTSAPWPVEASFKHEHDSRNMTGCTTVLAFSPREFLGVFI